jgi:D-lyxose ketol-isomerase
VITRSEQRHAQQRALEYLDRAGVVMTAEEREQIEVSDFGLSKLEYFGVQTLTYFNTDRICAKQIVLFPNQICPEHWHPKVGTDPGKEEIMRVRWGLVYVYIPGADLEPAVRDRIPERKEHFTVGKEMLLRPGDQIILAPGTVHWFQAGPEGAVIDDYSTTSRDVLDEFTDPDIVRITKIVD